MARGDLKIHRMQPDGLAAVGGTTVSECGHLNQLHFSRAFRKYFDMPPREWRVKKQG